MVNNDKKIAVVTDSTAGIKKDNDESIIVIPLSFIFGEDVFLDGVNINSHEFFDIAEKYFHEKNILPKTSQPSIGATIDAFAEILKDYDEIIYITISSEMSGTYQSGVLAANEFPNRVHVIDSRTTVAMQADLARFALKLVNQGMDSQKIVEKLEAVKGNCEVYFVVNSLEHLHRTGRISKMSMQLGSFLKLKPVLTITDGSVVVDEKIRTIKKAHLALVDKVAKMKVNDKTVITVLDAKADEYCEMLQKQVSELFSEKEIYKADISPVIAVNTGPKIIGVTVTNYEE